MILQLSKPLASDMAVEEADMRSLKIALNRLGYYTPPKEIGITGLPDRAAFEALKTFQNDQGFKPTGEVRPGDETVKALNSEIEKAKPQKYRWITVGDDKVRAGHAALDGTIRSFDEDPTPGSEPHCRCWAEPVSESPCDEERKNFVGRQKRVRELSDRLNDFLLELKKLEGEHNKLLNNAIKI